MSTPRFKELCRVSHHDLGLYIDDTGKISGVVLRTISKQHKDSVSINIRIYQQLLNSGFLLGIWFEIDYHEGQERRYEKKYLPLDKARSIVENSLQKEGKDNNGPYWVVEWSAIMGRVEDEEIPF